MKKATKADNQTELAGRRPAYIRRQIMGDEAKREAVNLVRLGFSPRYAAEQTGLTVGAVYYWTRITGYKCSDYRFGRSDIAQKVVEQTKIFTMKTLAQELNQLKLVNGHISHTIKGKK